MAVGVAVGMGAGGCCSWEKAQAIQYYPGPNNLVNYSTSGFLADGESFVLYVK